MEKKGSTCVKKIRVGGQKKAARRRLGPPDGGGAIKKGVRGLPAAASAAPILDFSLETCISRSQGLSKPHCVFSSLCFLNEFFILKKNSCHLSGVLDLVINFFHGERQNQSVAKTVLKVEAEKIDKIWS